MTALLPPTEIALMGEEAIGTGAAKGGTNPPLPSRALGLAEGTGTYGMDPSDDPRAGGRYDASLTGSFRNPRKDVRRGGLLLQDTQSSVLHSRVSGSGYSSNETGLLSMLAPCALRTSDTCRKKLLHVPWPVLFDPRRDLRQYYLPNPNPRAT